MTLGSISGPLGSYRNFIAYIALNNFQDYDELKRRHEETNNTSSSEKFKEVRYFLNSVESFNNILDYFYFEYESSIKYKKVEDFRSAVHKKYSELEAIANIANAYKHCVRVQKGQKNPNLPWAKDLQKPELKITINLEPFDVGADFNFHWPIPEQEEALTKAFKFWVNYHNKPFPDELKNA